MELYLIKTVTNGKELGLEYKLVKRKKDMRTSFCKKHKNDIVQELTLSYLISKYSLKIKENRLIMPNGNVAYKFKRDLDNNK